MKIKKYIGGAVICSLALVLVLPLTSEAALFRQLEIGMRGSDVSELQTFLATDPTIYPQGLVTGYFGSLTKSAVSNFQARNGLPSVGRVGPLTLALLATRMGGGSSADINAPVISNIRIATTTSQSTLTWNTNENALSRVYYSTSPIAMTEASASSGILISGEATALSGSMQTSHSASLTGLQSNTPYYYVIYTRDSNNNVQVTWPAVFMTSL